MELTLPLKIFEVGMTKTPLLISDMLGFLEAGGHSPHMFFNIQSDLVPRADAVRIVNLLSRDSGSTLQQNVQAYWDYVRNDDFTWIKSTEILKDIYIGLVNKKR